MSTLRFYFAASLLVLLNQAGASASVTDSSSLDWKLSVLRGTWRYFDFNEPTTVTFESDSRLTIDNHPLAYLLTPTKIRVYRDNDSTDYDFVIDADQLTWSFPEGREVVYKKVAGGSAEQFLEGDYYVTGDSASSQSTISFNGKDGFWAYIGSTPSSSGLYRVEGDLILFATDTGIDQAEIRSMDNDGVITSLTYHGGVYQKDVLSDGESTPSTDNNIVTYVPPPPPEPVYIPYFPPLPVGAATPTHAKTTPTPEKKRDIGNTRGNNSPKNR